MRQKEAERIAGELARLAREARGQGLDALAFLIEMAQFEAADQAKRTS